jgi:anti-sigma factor RsiW
MTLEPTGTFDCERVHSHLDAYLLDQVPPPERRAMRLHIQRCPACFARITERDPLQLFASLADQDRAPQAWEGFDSAIREGIQRDESRRATRRVWVRAAAVVAAVAAIGLAGSRLVPHRQAPGTVAVQERIADPFIHPDQRRAAGVPLPQTVERVRTSGSREVQVFSMNYYDQSGAGPGHLTELVLIVDAGLDL